MRWVNIIHSQILIWERRMFWELNDHSHTCIPTRRLFRPEIATFQFNSIVGPWRIDNEIQRRRAEFHARETHRIHLETPVGKAGRIATQSSVRPSTKASTKLDFLWTEISFVPTLSAIPLMFYWSLRVLQSVMTNTVSVDALLPHYPVSRRIENE